MSSTAPKQGSAVGTTKASNAAEPQYMSLNRVAEYTPNNIAADLSTRNPPPNPGNPDQDIASLEVDMARYRNTAQNVNPSSPLTGTGSKFK
ncbi:hypothetical protein FVEN_g9269 [Fusarium venenatum]|uniref:Uncharacterized protein n=1 Tax=Fusarium venenatum TaxID=56646 RepID=A0A2L2TEY9_9HYPO|nr:uncharacterized protein FVRRES_00493 [Fusarium venenatum]KAG8352866.1 hypothetical protein FVEN_g9269 [Fusarium venenatum]KAH7006267.1 hypothetical protein EDB82DRAFT_522225 [Fusarium venenatum]CEI63981.1 unnamed protein product [Fusarium venenatum]